MAGARFVTAAEAEQMWQLRQKGMTFKAIGEKMRRDPGTVSRHVKAYEAAVSAAKFERHIKEA